MPPERGPLCLCRGACVALGSCPGNFSEALHAEAGAQEVDLEWVYLFGLSFHLSYSYLKPQQN